jgi:SAM-dependent methyltransferase
LTERRALWANAEAYQGYIGRWSSLVAAEFLGRLAAPPTSRWLDLGCGTGALSAEATRRGAQDICGLDPSAVFVGYAAAHVRGRFVVGDAQRLPFRDRSFAVVVSALVLNFIPDLPAALAEVNRVMIPGGVAAAYVWDYAGEMQIMRRFWDAAEVIDPKAAALAEGRRFPICRPEPLAHAFTAAAFSDVTTWPIDVPTRFRDFDDFWKPFLGATGPAPAFVAALNEERRTALRDHLRATLPIAADGTIDLIARAWAVRAVRA